MRREDVGDVLLLENESGGNWTLAMMTAEYEHPAALFLVAQNKNNTGLIGFLCSRLAADEAEIIKLVVAESSRRKKVATSLLEEALNQVRRLGATACYLELRIGNTPARKLYEKHGFAPTGQRRGYYSEPKEDALLMGKKLKLNKKTS